MFFPIGVEEAQVKRLPGAQRPVVTFTLAVLTLAISLTVAWQAHLAATGPAFTEANAYWLAHPDLTPDPACERFLTHPPPGAELIPGREPGNPDKMTSLCANALAARASAEPLWLVRPEHGVVQIGTLTHGLAFPDLPSLLVGLILLVFVLGSFLEDRWGRDRFLAFWLMASLTTSLVFRRTLGDSAGALAGGTALSAACLGAFAVTLGGRKIQYLVLGPGGLQRRLAPAWTVALFWLLTRFLLVLFGHERSPAETAAELSGFAVGIVTGLIARAQNWQRSDAPAVVVAEPSWVKPTEIPNSPRTVKPPDPEPPRPLFDEPETPRAPMVVPANPLLQTFTPVSELEPRAKKPVAPVLFDDPPPLLDEDAGSGWARFRTEEPALPPPSPPRVEHPPAPKPMPQSVVPPLETMAIQAKPLPPKPVAQTFKPGTIGGVRPNTQNYGDKSKLAIQNQVREAKVQPQRLPVTRWQLTGREGRSLTFLDEQGTPIRLSPQRILAVTVGIVRVGEGLTTGPALLLDIVVDDEPRRTIRLRPSAEVLGTLWPDETRADALAALARELAAAGALRLPQTSDASRDFQWPGPPWPTFADLEALEAVSASALARDRR